ncbi:MAG: hypothetical protein ACKO99_10835 [Dolichospermum sp.]
MQLLTDKTQVLAVLINCRIEGNRLMCGAAVFRGGMSGEIEVSNESQVFKIKIPESVQNCATHQIFKDKHDNLEIELCAQ